MFLKKSTHDINQLTVREVVIQERLELSGVQLILTNKNKTVIG